MVLGLFFPRKNRCSFLLPRKRASNRSASRTTHAREPMALKAYLKVERDVLLPAVLGLTVVAVSVIVLVYLRRRRLGLTGTGGTEYVTNLDGSIVRRSTRSVYHPRLASACLPSQASYWQLNTESGAITKAHTALKRPYPRCRSLGSQAEEQLWLHCRSRKSVARWSPDDPASPTGYGTPKTLKTAVKVSSTTDSCLGTRKCHYVHNKATAGHRRQRACMLL